MNIFIKGLPFDSLELGLHYQWEIVENNGISYSWDFGNSTFSESPIVVFNADRVGTRNVCVNVSVNGWFNKNKCFEIVIREPFTNLADPTKIVTFSQDITFSTEDEIIRGINYGKLIKFGTQIWLSQDVPASPSAQSLVFQCPSGFR